MDFSFIVCSNGYGHIKRVLSVANAMFNQKTDLSIAIVAKPELIDYVKQQPNFHWNTKLHIDTTATLHEPDWKKPPKDIVEQTETWIHELSKNKTLIHTQQIISDNHIAPLSVFQNAILMGSFFWHQVLPDLDPLFKAKQESLLQTLRPKHLCLADMVMPEASTATKATGLPWFCKNQVPHSTPAKQVFITGGGTAVLNDTLSKVVRLMHQNLPDWKVWVDSKLMAYCSSQGMNADEFSFREQDFARLGAIICRPGIGILTDCIQYGIPAFSVVEESNAEIVHNGKQFKAKGYGLNHQVGSETDLLDEVTAFLSNHTQLQQFRQRINNAKKEGATAAALYLLNTHYDE